MHPPDILYFFIIFDSLYVIIIAMCEFYPFIIKLKTKKWNQSNQSKS